MFGPAPFIGGGLRLKLLTSVTSTTSTIVVPATVRAGDLLLLLDYSNNTLSPATNVVPTGFTQIATLTLSTLRCTWSYKIADADDEGDTLTGVNGSDRNNKLLAVLRPNRPITGATVNSLAGYFDSGDPPAQTVPASAGDVPLLVIGAYASTVVPTATLDPRTFTVDGVDAKDWEAGHTTGTFDTLYLAGAFFAKDPQDVVADMEDETTNCLQSLYFELTF